MNFYNWMMRNHRDEDTPEGDLAADMEHVKDTFQGTESASLMDGTG